MINIQLTIGDTCYIDRYPEYLLYIEKFEFDSKRLMAFPVCEFLDDHPLGFRQGERQKINPYYLRSE